ncbi:MAG: 3-isopropylmalate dehydratase small subunit [Desulfobacteraceae bacterium]|nr:3-isopropylmalate dehydratase small subunit [Desulfobacteraceae bacterium]MBU4055657.1 3-isopropylmalate dehydratase small subunit [Pseudomonadota bacterium]
MKMIHGNIWKFGDGIDTDIIIPARHLVLPMEEMKKYAMEPLDPEFAGRVQPGDVIVAGRNFGCGSSREQAPAVLKALGIKAVVAKSFARIFFRNAINLGLVVVECPELADHVQTGNVIDIDPVAGKIRLPKQALEFSGSKLPDFLMEILAAGGLIAHLAQRG